MPISIKRLQLTNFRGIKSAEIHFPQHCILLGANNCGKTSIVEAISLALGRDRPMHQIDDYDFFGGFFDKNIDSSAKRFFIKIVIYGFEGNDSRLSPEWFNTQNAGTGSWWDEEEKKY